MLLRTTLGLIVVAGTGCSKAPPPSARTSIHVRYAQLAATAVPGALPGDTSTAGSWPLPAKDFANSRFSALDQINATNVGSLRLAFTFSTGLNRGHEAAPLVVNNTMYIITPYPNILFALDLTKPGAPLKWTFKPEPKASAQGVACCDVVNRGASYADGKIVFNTLDGQTIAVSADDGKELWRTQLADMNLGESLTMAPLVAKNKVLVGVSGSEFGIRGWLVALDLGSGKVVWRAYHTGPDKDVLIGSRFKPFYPTERGTDLGVQSWPGETWKIGGGGVWGWVSYDPTLNLIYYGTANPGPWNADQRPGENKWTAGIFARDLDSGEAVWFVPTSPHDLFDYDSINELILLDLPIGGATRKVVVRPERNGFIYVIDRQTGEVLSADMYGPVTSYTGFNLKAGRPVENPAKHPETGKTVRDICPAAPGMKDWQPAAFSPRTGMLYVPHQLLCMDVENVEANYIAGTPYVGMNVKMYAAPGGYRGEFLAWDVVHRRPA